MWSPRPRITGPSVPNTSAPTIAHHWFMQLDDYGDDDDDDDDDEDDDDESDGLQLQIRAHNHSSQTAVVDGGCKVETLPSGV